MEPTSLRDAIEPGTDPAGDASPVEPTRMFQEECSSEEESSEGCGDEVSGEDNDDFMFQDGARSHRGGPVGDDDEYGLEEQHYDDEREEDLEVLNGRYLAAPFPRLCPQVDPLWCATKPCRTLGPMPE